MSDELPAPQQVTSQTLASMGDGFSVEIGKLGAALAAAQGAMSPAAKGSKNPHLKNSYADLSAIICAARGPMSDNGLSYTQMPSVEHSENSARVALVTLVMHESGQWLRNVLYLPVEEGRGINTKQATGAAISYARRYALSSLLGVATGDDTDGSVGQTPDQNRGQQRPSTKELRLSEFKRVGIDPAKWDVYSSQLEKPMPSFTEFNDEFFTKVIKSLGTPEGRAKFDAWVEGKDEVPLVEQARRLETKLDADRIQQACQLAGVNPDADLDGLPDGLLNKYIMILKGHMAASGGKQ